MSCPICEANALSQFAQIFDDRYAYPGQFQLVQCQKCRHAFLDVKMTPNQLSDLYTNYYPRRNFDVDAHRPYQESTGFGAWLRGDRSSPFRWIPRNVRILDIGCGFGESLGYHQNRGCDAHGVEADGNIRRVADKYGYKVHVGLFDAGIYEESTFDFVTMSQVIEHVVDPVAVLQGIYKVLKPGSQLILSTPNARGWGAWLFGKKWINWHAPYHLHFFSDLSLRQAAEKAGFIVERKHTITPSAWLHYQWIHLLTYPAIGQPSIFWGAENTWTRTQTISLKLLNLIDSVGINHLITRVFDSAGLGDNSLYFLRKP